MSRKVSRRRKMSSGETIKSRVAGMVVQMLNVKQTDARGMKMRSLIKTFESALQFKNAWFVLQM